MKRLALFCLMLVAVAGAQTHINGDWQINWLGVTVSGLPGSPYTGQTLPVTDANPDCNTGGGSGKTFCRWNGASWDTMGSSSGSMVYPGAGIANSTGSAWGTSYSSGNKIPTNILNLTGYALLASPTFTGTVGGANGNFTGNFIIGGTVTFSSLTGGPFCLHQTAGVVSSAAADCGTSSGGVSSIQPQNNGVNYGSPLTGAVVMNFANCTVSGTFTVTCAGSGTVNAGTAGQIAYYATSSSAVSGTNTLPSGLTANLILPKDLAVAVAQGAGGCSLGSNFTSASAPTCVIVAGSATTAQMASMAFPAATAGTQYAEWNWELPNNLVANGIASVQIGWYNDTDVSSHNTVWNFKYACIAPNGAIQPTLSAAQTITGATTGTVNQYIVATLTPSITGCLAGYHYQMRIALDATNAATGNNDILAVRVLMNRAQVTQ